VLVDHFLEALYRFSLLLESVGVDVRLQQKARRFVQFLLKSGEHVQVLLCLCSLLGAQLLLLSEVLSDHVYDEVHELVLIKELRNLPGLLLALEGLVEPKLAGALPEPDGLQRHFKHSALLVVGKPDVVMHASVVLGKTLL